MVTEDFKSATGPLCHFHLPFISPCLECYLIYLVCTWMHLLVCNELIYLSENNNGSYTGDFLESSNIHGNNNNATYDYFVIFIRCS